MYCIKKGAARNEEEKISTGILNWYEGRENFLNVISVPYNTTQIFLRTILWCVKNEKKVLYITEEKENSISILNILKKNTGGSGYEYIKNINKKVLKQLCFSNINTALNYPHRFDLYIYDDISSFSEKDTKKTVKMLQQKMDSEAKLVSYTAESMDFCKSELFYPVASHRQPVIEPRTIITKLDINKDIPLEAFEYIKWSLSCRRNVIIYVPQASTAVNAENYLTKYCKEDGVNLSCYIKGKSSMKNILNFMKMKNNIIITDDCSDIFLNSKDTDVMIFNADSEAFDYKKLLYISSRAGRKMEQKRGEAVFLAREETCHMEKAKNIARNFNKEAWECGLLKL